MNLPVRMSHLITLIGGGLVLALAVCGPAYAEGEDLSRIYKGTLDYEEGAIGRDWTCGKEDAWSLNSFGYSFKDKLEVRLGASTVIFGRNGSNVVWAAVIPEGPGEIVKAPAGQGEHVTSIFLRFNPALVGELFPPETVTGRGAREKLVWAIRIYSHKINASWQNNNMPVIPYKESIVLDCETAEGSRRFYSIDTKKGMVEYVPAFESRRIPDPPATSFAGASNVGVFDQVWEAFDKEYAMFVVKPSVDWNALKEQYRPMAEKAQTPYEVAGVISLMLAHLQDLHVYVRVGDEYLWCFSRFRPLNASWKATQGIIGNVQELGKQVRAGRTIDNLGYIAVDGLSGENLVETFDQALEQLRDTKGLVLDLRFNGGGDEPMAQKMAGRFVDREQVYSMDQYRNGPRHDDLGPKLKRSFGPRGPWRYGAPVAVLCGQKTMSSAESFVLMMAQCPQATVMGDRTAGSSANPRRLDLPGEISVNVPRWLDMDAAGNPIDAVGVKPDIMVDAAPTAFTNTQDPVLEAALKALGEGKVGKPGEEAAKRQPAPMGEGGERVPVGPPRVVSMVPANGATDVDPKLRSITITFDRPMKDRSWSVCGGGPDLPKIVGAGIRYDRERKVLTIPVVLEPGKTYRFSLNSPSYQNFKSAEGVPLEPMPVTFMTRSE